MDLDRDLNAQQREAARADGAATLVLAGAGSGKTRVLTYRIARLLGEGVEPWRILAVTFTNKAAGEMRARVERLCGGAAGGLPLEQGRTPLWMGTFHAICARLLRAHGEAIGVDRRFVIFDDDDRVALVTRILKDQQVAERFFAPRAVAAHLDRAKNLAQGPDEYRAPDLFADVVAACYAEYEKRLRESRALDFGDLLLGGLRLATHAEAGAVRARFRHVLVDEYQDTNRVQYLLARALATDAALFAVGDPDQSIYAFRGADIRNVLDFERDFPGARVLRLEQNYRSTPSILRAAQAMIAHNAARKPKDLWTANADGPRPLLVEAEDERDEAAFVVETLRALRREGVRPGDAGVFYRTHAQSRALEEALRATGTAYVVVGGMRFYERAEVKDAIAYLRVILCPGDVLDLRRIVNVPTRGIGDTTLDRVAAHAAERGVPLWEAMVAASREDMEVLKPPLRRKLAAFVHLIEDLREAAAADPPSRVLERVLERSGYAERFAIEGTPEAQSRLENLKELLVSVRDYEQEPGATLEGFLERVTLASDVDGWNEDEGRVSLMTVHSAKGLEFPVVFVTGLEENLFPHARSLTDDGAIEEERRLLYVAMTRARRRLYLAHARARRLFAQETASRPSRFLREIPHELLDAESRGGEAPLRAPGEVRPGRVWIDRSDGQVELPPRTDGLRAGLRVRHRMFGDGVVRAVAGGGDDTKLTIDFPRVGRKTILARFVERG